MKFKKGDFLESDLPCKLCYSRQRRVLATKGRNLQDLTTVVCTGCGLIHSHPIPTKLELDTYYSQQYRSDYKLSRIPPRKHVLRYSSHAVERVRTLLKFTSAKGTKLLDIGSGSGEFVYLAQLAQIDASGLEPHIGYSEYTQKTFGVPIINAPLESAKIQPASYDVITLHHVLEHLQFPLTSLSILNGWLKPGGILMVDVPNIEADHHSPTNRYHYAHLYNFNHMTLKGFLQKAGFEVIPHASFDGTTLAARKTDAPCKELVLSMPENYQRIWDKLGEASTVQHYTTTRPYQRFLSKCRRYPVEFIKATLLWNPRSIVRHTFNRERTTLTSP